MDKGVPVVGVEVDWRIQYTQTLLDLIEPYFVGRARLRFGGSCKTIEKILLCARYAGEKKENRGRERPSERKSEDLIESAVNIRVDLCDCVAISAVCPASGVKRPTKAFPSIPSNLSTISAKPHSLLRGETSLLPFTH